MVRQKGRSAKVPVLSLVLSVELRAVGAGFRPCDAARQVVRENMLKIYEENLY